MYFLYVIRFLLVDFGLSQFTANKSPDKTPQNSKLPNKKRKRVEDSTCVS